MALTLEVEQQLRDAEVIEFYDRDADAWLETVRDVVEFVRRHFPNGAVIRQDDIAKALVPFVEVHEAFQTLRKEKKLRAKYWNRQFADLLVDRTWDQIDRGNQ